MHSAECKLHSAIFSVFFVKLQFCCFSIFCWGFMSVLVCFFVGSLYFPFFVLFCFFSVVVGCLCCADVGSCTV